MECNVREISNAVMIESLDAIIQQESWKLETDKNSGLLAKKSKMSTVQMPLKKNKNIVTQNKLLLNHSKSYSPKLSNRMNEIERLANLFTQSPCYFSLNNNNNSTDVKYNQVLLKENTSSQIYNFQELGNHKAFLDSKNNVNLNSQDIKVRRNVRFGEYSPLNPANQVNSQPFLGIGEYENKKKQLLESQKKEYVEYLTKAKEEKIISDLPKLKDYSCGEVFKAAMEDNNSLKEIKLDKKSIHNQDNVLKSTQFGDEMESCTSDEDRKKETNRLKQELYRLELRKQIEEKKRLEEERKHKEQLEDEAIERAAREQEEKIKREYEKEVEKRHLVQLQKQLQQEKLKNEIIQKQKDLETVPQHVLKHNQSKQKSSEEDDIDEFHQSQSLFDDEPLPTTRIRAPRKIVYDDEIDCINRKTRDVSCNTDMFRNPCMNENISLPVRQNMERAHVSFAREPPLKRTEYNPVALLPVTKSMIIDSPHTLALTGLDDNDDDELCKAVEPKEVAYSDQISEEMLLGNNHVMPTDKHLLSNLGNIRKQLDIEHQILKQKVRNSQ